MLSLLVAGPALISACGGGNGDGDGDAGGDGDGDGTATGGMTGVGDGDGDVAGDHFTPPSSLSDNLMSEGEANASLDNYTDNLCDPGFFRTGGIANDEPLSGGLGIGSASFSAGPGVETFTASAGSRSITVSYSSSTADGQNALMAGRITTPTAGEFCFEGVLRSRVQVEGVAYVVFASRTLFESVNGSCTTTPLGGIGNSLSGCVATEPLP